MLNLIKQDAEAVPQTSIYILRIKQLPEDQLRHIIANNNLSFSDWHFISCNHVLSEGFIREFKDKVHWRGVTFYQKLSDSFINEFKQYVEPIGRGIIKPVEVL